MEGSEERVCEDGGWSGQPARCEFTRCPDPEPVENAEVKQVPGPAGENRLGSKVWSFSNTSLCTTFCFVPIVFILCHDFIDRKVKFRFYIENRFLEDSRQGPKVTGMRHTSSALYFCGASENSLHKPRVNFANMLFQINYGFNYCLQFLNVSSFYLKLA